MLRQFIDYGLNLFLDYTEIKANPLYKDDEKKEITKKLVIDCLNKSINFLKEKSFPNKKINELMRLFDNLLHPEQNSRPREINLVIAYPDEKSYKEKKSHSYEEPKIPSINFLLLTRDEKQISELPFIFINVGEFFENLNIDPTLNLKALIRVASLTSDYYFRRDGSEKRSDAWTAELIITLRQMAIKEGIEQLLLSPLIESEILKRYPEGLNSLPHKKMIEAEPRSPYPIYKG